jgi:hypothetical protein
MHELLARHVAGPIIPGTLWIAKMRTLLHVAAVLLLAASAIGSQAACLRCDPILNVNGALVAPPANKTVSAEDVRAAIIRAGAGLGWQIKDDGPGKLVGVLVLRKHTAVVDIPYSATTFSIIYKSSINLDEADGQIHKNYNGWISNLQKGIGTQMLLI